MHDDNYLITRFGVRMPKIIYGTAWKKDSTEGLVELAVTLGFRGIDTACQPKHYHEPGVGAGLASGLARSELYLQTKFTPFDGQDPKRIPYDPEAELSLQVEQSVATSLSNLRTDYLDCLILHSPYAQEWQTMEVWQAMESLFNEGVVKQLGISNCYQLETLENICRKASITPAVLQNRFYPSTHYDRAIREFCRRNQIQYQGFWTLTANPHILGHDRVSGLAEQYARTTEQIFYRFLTQTDVIPLIGTTSEAHMREDLAIFEFTLTQGECDAVARLLI